MRNRLRYMRAYLCGGMDNAKDGGVGWRKRVGRWLARRGVVILDPTDKPTDAGVESPEIRAHWNELKATGHYAELAAAIKLIRGIDLRMVDISDFLVVYLDREQYPCGTYEELFLANREKKPVLVVSPQGKKGVSNWMFGTIPHQHIFGSWHELYRYLNHIDCDEHIEYLRRWHFFTFKKAKKPKLSAHALKVVEIEAKKRGLKLPKGLR